DTEPRSALVTVVRSPDGTERVVINVHLATGGPQQRAQLEGLAAIAEAEAARGRPVVVTGDFNMSPGTVEAVLGNHGFEHASGASIDQTWVVEGTSTSSNADVSTEGGSDHGRAPTTTLDG